MNGGGETNFGSGHKIEGNLVKHSQVIGDTLADANKKYKANV